MELETFQIAVLPLREKLLRFSFKLTEDRADAEDTVQETFLKLWSIRERLDAYRSVEALAMAVAKNLSLDKVRNRKSWLFETGTLAVDSGQKDPSEQLEERDDVAYIRMLIASLPPLQQMVVRMKDVEGYEMAEIAAIAGTSVEAVRVNLSRARKKIKDEFFKRREQEETWK